MESKDNDAPSLVADSENRETGDHKITDQDHLLFLTTDNSSNRPRIDGTTSDISCSIYELRGHVDECWKTEDQNQNRDKENVEKRNDNSGRQESGAIRKSLPEPTSRNKQQESLTGGHHERVWEIHERRESIQEPCTRKQQEEIRTSICWPQLSVTHFRKF
jgi:hypothetical protein